MSEMTGLERLRELGREQEERSWSTVGKVRGRLMLDIADQIEREQGEDCYRMGLDHGAVWRVVTDMECHVLGHEGMEDNPVARWARELREALGGDECDHADEREAIAWVRKHGGLDSVKEEWHSRVPYDKYKEKRQRLLDHIAECETALGRRREIIKELGHRVNDLTAENAELRKRAMPQGCKWPCYEDGESVMFGGFAADAFGTALDEPIFSVELFENGFTLHGDGVQAFYGYEERVRRPAALAADGEPLEVGQTVWDTNGDELVVGALEDGGRTVTCRYADVGDGIPVHGMWSPSHLTHERPDSWGRITEDIASPYCADYCVKYGVDHSSMSFEYAKACDIVRRARALAERGL